MLEHWWGTGFIVSVLRGLQIDLHYEAKSKSAMFKQKRQLASWLGAALMLAAGFVNNVTPTLSRTIRHTHHHHHANDHHHDEHHNHALTHRHAHGHRITVIGDDHSSYQQRLEIALSSASKIRRFAVEPSWELLPSALALLLIDDGMQRLRRDRSPPFVALVHLHSASLRSPPGLS